MKRFVAASLATLLLVSAMAWAADADAPAATPSPGASSPGASSSPRDLLKLALELWHEKSDMNGAQLAFYEAVAEAPADPEVRFSRAMFFESVAGLVRDSDRAGFLQRAREDYREAMTLDPSGRLGGLSRDRLAVLEDRQLFAAPRATCGEDAMESFRRAESLFGEGRYRESLPPFKLAADLCPASVSIWIAYADAHYALGEYEMAKALFLRALEASPWDREAHRFLADAEAELGDRQSAARESALAVLSDPTCESAWESLRDHSTARSSTWNRVPQIGSSAAVPETGPDRDAWESYASLRSALLSGRDVPSIGAAHAAGHLSRRSALEQAQQLVRTALGKWREVPGADPEQPGSFWAMMSRADRAGYLDEAIYLHLMNASLAPEYIQFRDKNRDRLIAYLESVIAPPMFRAPTGEANSSD